MTSVLNVDTIAAKDGTSPATLTKQIPAKFRIRHSGDAVTVNDSFNNSSLSDDGTGKQTYNFTNSFSNTFFTTTAISTEDGSRGYVTMYYSRDYAPSTSNVQTQGIDQGDSFEDGEFTSAVAHGDLA